MHVIINLWSVEVGWVEAAVSVSEPDARYSLFFYRCQDDYLRLNYMQVFDCNSDVVAPSCICTGVYYFIGGI